MYFMYFVQEQSRYMYETTYPVTKASIKTMVNNN